MLFSYIADLSVCTRFKKLNLKSTECFNRKSTQSRNFSMKCWWFIMLWRIWIFFSQNNIQPAFTSSKVGYGLGRDYTSAYNRSCVNIPMDLRPFACVRTVFHILKDDIVRILELGQGHSFNSGPICTPYRAVLERLTTYIRYPRTYIVAWAYGSPAIIIIRVRARRVIGTRMLAGRRTLVNGLILCLCSSRHKYRQLYPWAFITFWSIIAVLFSVVGVFLMFFCSPPKPYFS